VIVGLGYAIAVRPVQNPDASTRDQKNFGGEAFSVLAEQASAPGLLLTRDIGQAALYHVFLELVGKKLP